MSRNSWYRRERAIWPWIVATLLAFAYLPYLRWQIARDPFHSQFASLVNIFRCLVVLGLLSLILMTLKGTRRVGLSLMLGLGVYSCVACMLLPATFGLRTHWQNEGIAAYVAEYDVVIEAIADFEADTGRLPTNLAELRPAYLSSALPRAHDLSYIVSPQRSMLRVPDWSSNKEYLLILRVYYGGFFESVALYYYVPGEQYPADMDRVGLRATQNGRYPD